MPSEGRVKSETAELATDGQRALAELIYQDPQELAEAALSGAIAVKGELLREFIESEQRSKHFSPSGIVALHDRLVDDALAEGDRIGALAAVQTFQKVKYNMDVLMKELTRLYIVAHRAGVRPLPGAVNMLHNRDNLRLVAKNVTEADYQRVVDKVGAEGE